MVTSSPQFIHGYPFEEWMKRTDAWMKATVSSVVSA